MANVIYRSPIKDEPETVSDKRRLRARYLRAFS